MLDLLAFLDVNSASVAIILLGFGRGWIVLVLVGISTAVLVVPITLSTSCYKDR
jgi:hypothetical protein